MNIFTKQKGARKARSISLTSATPSTAQSHSFTSLIPVLVCFLSLSFSFANSFTSPLFWVEAAFFFEATMPNYRS